eukprot:365334-Chlamydomonas_euryale.AAC.15
MNCLHTSCSAKTTQLFCSRAAAVASGQWRAAAISNEWRAAAIRGQWQADAIHGEGTAARAESG